MVREKRDETMVKKEEGETVVIKRKEKMKLSCDDGVRLRIIRRKVCGINNRG